VDTNPNDVPNGELPPLQTIEDRLNQVFVSPRVVDQRAFEDLSATLRGLMKDAVGQNRVLMGTTGEIKNLSEQLRFTGNELQERIDSARKIMPTIDQRLTKAEQISMIINRDIAARLETLKGAVVDHEALAASVREQTKQTIDRVISEQMESFGETVAKLIAEKLVRAKDACDETIRAAQTKLGIMLARTDGCVARLSTLQRDADDRLSAAQKMLERLEDATDHLETSTNSITTSLDNGLKDIEGRLTDTSQQCEKLLCTTREQMTLLAEQARALDAQALDAQTLRATVSDAADAIARGTEVALQLRELTARGTQQHEEDNELAERFALLIHDANAVGPKLAALVQRGDAVGKGLATLVGISEKKVA
jgi:chromosome segregation ATPase